MTKSRLLKSRGDVSIGRMADSVVAYTFGWFPVVG